MSAGEAIYRRLPGWAGAAAKQAWFVQARLTAAARALPDFVVIGAQRCGTTSLYEYLVADPQVHRALTKEVRFVDVHHDRGAGWYRSHFPLQRTLARAAASGRPAITGEASPDYLFYPSAAERLAEVVGGARLVALLRDPVERAHSHYWHQVRRGFEHRPFEQAIAEEPSRCGDPVDVAAGRAGPIDSDRHHFSYLARGLYALQLERWLRFFPREQLLVLESAHLFADPMASLARVHDFLGIDPPRARAHAVHNQMAEGSIPSGLRTALLDRFASHDEALTPYLGGPPSWRSG